jgi:predicted amidophosphoribosyltransferase
LVDDVVTTGSTLESCIQKIQKVLPDIQITVLSLAIAK